jgi:hypothetical protein
LPLRQSPDGGFFCEGCVSRECTTAAQVMSVASEAAKNRVVRSHALNQDSSRSHAIFIINVEREMMVPAAAAAASSSGGDDRAATAAAHPTQMVPAMRYGKLIFVDRTLRMGNMRVRRGRRAAGRPGKMRVTCAHLSPLFFFHGLFLLFFFLRSGR